MTNPPAAGDTVLVVVGTDGATFSTSFDQGKAVRSAVVEQGVYTAESGPESIQYSLRLLPNGPIFGSAPSAEAGGARGVGGHMVLANIGDLMAVTYSSCEVLYGDR
jgi:hypothetical protein